MSCPFCDRIASGEVLESNGVAAALPDGFPVSPGHTLVVPRRHEPDLWRLDPETQRGVWDLVAAVRVRLDRDLGPDGFNVGVNVGAAAGQTVEHAHVHVIPRRLGDVADPRGGVRWVLPAKARYWT
jgi:diadenosine tetraphosphate (Ap4A) HIT family hydrolase